MGMLLATEAVPQGRGTDITTCGSKISLAQLENAAEEHLNTRVKTCMHHIVNLGDEGPRDAAAEARGFSSFRQ